MPLPNKNKTKTKTSVEPPPNLPTSGSSEDLKDTNKYNLSKFEYDLYHEEDDVAEKVIRVKHFSLPNKGDRWKIFEDNKILQIIEGGKLTNKEKEFLRSVEGATWLLSRAKVGIKSFNSFRKELKAKLNV